MGVMFILNKIDLSDALSLILTVS